MYYTRGNVTSAGPIKNAHHTHERERMLAKRKFLDFVQSYKRAQYNQQPTQVPTNADLMEFSDYVRMLDTRTSPRPAHSPEHQLHKQRATSNYSHNRKKSKIIDSCQPYFIVTIPKTAPQSKDSSKADYSRMKRVDPLPLQRVRRSNIV